MLKSWWPLCVHNLCLVRCGFLFELAFWQVFITTVGCLLGKDCICETPTPYVQQGVAIWSVGRSGAQSVLKTDPLETVIVRLYYTPFKYGT